MTTHPECFPQLTVGTRVRFFGPAEAHEPQGTICEVGYNAVKIKWDDEHPISLVDSGSFKQLEVLK